MDRREFLASAAALTALGCANVRSASGAGNRMLFGACRGIADVKLLKSIGYDFWEWSAWQAFDPGRDDEWWKKQRDLILAQPIPLRSCNGLLGGAFRLTGPQADFEPALRYAEKVLRRAEEVGVKTVVFGSAGARNAPGDYTVKDGKPDVERGVRQYADFCRVLCARVSDLKETMIVIEPLRPNETNVVNYVWQGVQICRAVNSPRLGQLADIFHMMMGGEEADSLVRAGALLKHCHIAEYGTRSYPGHDPAQTDRLRPYFAALKEIDYAGGISCEVRWGEAKNLAHDLETALTTMKGLI